MLSTPPIYKMIEQKHNLDYWSFILDISTTNDLLNEKGIEIKKKIINEIPLNLSDKKKIEVLNLLLEIK